MIKGKIQIDFEYNGPGQDNPAFIESAITASLVDHGFLSAIDKTLWDVAKGVKGFHYGIMQVKIARGTVEDMDKVIIAKYGTKAEVHLKR